MTFVRPPLEAEPPDRDSLEGRASLALKVIAAINGFAVVLAFFPPPVPAPRLETVAFNVASALLVVLMLVVARGLDKLRPWAFAAVRPLLVVVVVAGVYQLAMTLLDGKIRIPFDAGLAIWSFLAPRHELPSGFDSRDRRGLGAVVGAAVLTVAMLFARPLFAWGGALDVRPDAFGASMSVECGVAAPGEGPPDIVTITYDWSWTGSSPLPDGLDAVVVGWDGDDSQGRPLYTLGRTLAVDPGVYDGRRGYPSREMTAEAAAGTRSWWNWGVELVERGYAPGHLVVELERAQDAPPDPEPLTIKASYVHLGIWRQDAQAITCSW